MHKASFYDRIAHRLFILRQQFLQPVKAAGGIMDKLPNRYGRLGQDIANILALETNLVTVKDAKAEPRLHCWNSGTCILLTLAVTRYCTISALKWSRVKPTLWLAQPVAVKQQQLH